MKYQVYRNLHTGLFSIREKRSGLVVAHAYEVVLENVVFTVHQSGRARVLKERSKNVHAWVEGDVVMFVGRSYKDRQITTCPSEVREDRKGTFTYNPYKYESFVDSNLQPLYNARRVRLSMDSNGVALCEFA